MCTRFLPGAPANLSALFLVKRPSKDEPSTNKKQNRADREPLTKGSAGEGRSPLEEPWLLLNTERSSGEGEGLLQDEGL